MSVEDDYPYSTVELGLKVGLERKAVRRRAAALGLGINLDGRAGYRYSEADYRKFVESMKVAKPVEKRRRRRSA